MRNVLKAYFEHPCSDRHLLPFSRSDSSLLSPDTDSSYQAARSAKLALAFNVRHIKRPYLQKSIAKSVFVHSFHFYIANLRKLRSVNRFPAPLA